MRHHEDDLVQPFEWRPTAEQTKPVSTTAMTDNGCERKQDAADYSEVPERRLSTPVARYQASSCSTSSSGLRLHGQRVTMLTQ